MQPETVKYIIEIIAISLWPLGFGAIIYTRFQKKGDDDWRGIGVRVIQLTAVVLLFPLILILGLEKVLDSSVMGTLIGGLVGYLLSGIGDYDRNRDKSPN
jgi:hypothetical protein